MKPVAAPADSPPPSPSPYGSSAQETLLGLVGDLLRRPWLQLGPLHFLDEGNAWQWLPPTALAELQRAKLRRLAWHCLLNVPGYARAFGATLTPTAIERLERVAQLPLVAAEVRRAGEGFAALAGAPPAVVERQTAGGHRVRLDANADKRHTAARLRAEAWAGAPPGKVVALWGRDALRAPRALDAAELRALAVALGRVPAAVVSGPGAALGELAAALVGRPAGAPAPSLFRRRAALAAATVIARGDDPGGQGARLASLLGARSIGWYGAAEVGQIAAPCERGGLHVHADQLIVEVVGPDGQPLAPGGAGRVLVTDLHGYAAPYLRYDLGDRARLLPQPCACGRGLPLVELLGRA